MGSAELDNQQLIIYSHIITYGNGPMLLSLK